MYKSFVLGLKDKDEWQKYLERIEPAKRDIYFTTGYYQLYEELGDGTAKCFVFTNGDEIAMYPFLINPIEKEKFGTDSTYYDIQGAYGYNGVIYNSSGQTFINEFNKAFNTYCEENKIIAEFVRFHPLLENRHFSKTRMKIIEDRETVYLDLKPDLKDIWTNQFTSVVRNKIRKALKRNYTSELISYPSLDQLQTFIDIYTENMEMVNAEKYFYFNEDYFKNTFKYLADYSYLMNVKNENGEVVTSTILFKYGPYMHYHLSGRSSRAKSWVSNFLFSEAIKHAKEVNAQVLHFGGGRGGSADDSLLKFKKYFSKDSAVFALGKLKHYEDVYNFLEERWNAENPQKKEEYKNFLLKYRITAS